ncbi:MAG: glucan endo-1,3-beta-D-glucosidase, partial [Chitinophagaceae bacterium]|nr:glucan endo-1,3-beta-D-glucosidase [Chitinophagaceae bacterium]
MFKMNKLTVAVFSLVMLLAACKKQEYTFGDLINPSGLTLTTAVVGVDAANPNGNGSGQVTITAKATGALTYQIDFGDGVKQVVPSGTLTYKYNTPGVNNFTITVNAVGTGGSLSTISKRITVFVAFQIPANIVAALTGTGSKVWVTDKDAPGHFGVGPNNEFSP